MVGNCRHFATLPCALLRFQGRAARAHCGFGAYFESDRYVDHWVCEAWDSELGRWRLVDAQIDDRQREVLSIELDTLDVSREQFWVAGQAWRRARCGEVDPLRFGILDMWGLWFVRGNLLRDLAALNRVELLPWDNWGLMLAEAADAEAPGKRDRVAEVTMREGVAARELGALYEGDAALCAPEKIQSFRDGALTQVEIVID